jgi:CheY-like chemotaxis protein
MSEKIGIRAGYINPGRTREDGRKIEEFFGKIFSEFRWGDRKELERYCFGETPCDLILIDCRDGERMDGCLELVREMKGRTPVPTLLVLYDAEGRKHLPQLVEAGVRYFFPVPWSGEAVRYVLRPLIELLTLPRRLRSCRRMLEEYRRREGEGGFSSEECRLLRKRLAGAERYFRIKTKEMEEYLHEAMNMTVLLSQSGLNEEQREYLGRMDHAVSGMRDLLRELKEYSETKEGEEERTFNLNTILQSSGEAADRRFEEAGIDLVFEMERGVPSRIRGNPVLLAESLVDLFDSLIALDGGGEVILRVRMDDDRTEGEEKILRFELEHTGEIPAELGDPVEYLKRSALVAEASRWIRRMGGELRFGEGEGGPLMAFRLPVSRLDRRSYRLPSRAWMKKSMLIVDDNEHSANALKTMLEYFHFHVERAASVREALQILYTGRFDLIFVREGLFDEFLKEGISLRRDAALVMVTHDEERRRKNAEYAERVDAFLSLPFTQQKIFDLLLKVFSREKLEERDEVLEILRENLVFLLGGKTALYIGRGGSDLEMVRELLERIRIILLHAENPERARKLHTDAELVFLDGRWSAGEWEQLLPLCRDACREKPLFALLEDAEEETKRKLEGMGVSATIPTPVEPESFYRQLLDVMLERGTL